MTEAPPLIAERFLDFTLTVEWELKNDISPDGCFKILYPFCFPRYHQPAIIPITKEQSGESVTVNCCVDSFFVDAAFRNPFTFHLLYSKDVLENPEIIENNENDAAPPQPIMEPQNFIPEKIQLDGSLLFLPDNVEASITIKDFNDFESITFSMYCETQLLSEDVFKIFAPAFIHLWKLTNLPPNEGNDSTIVPTYFSCRFGNSVFNIISRGLEIETVIPVEYREQTEITFNVHNHEKIYPNTLFGSGIIKPLVDKPVPPNYVASYGTTTFELLPERRKRAKLQQSDQTRNEFNVNSCEVSYHIFDPSSDVDPIPENRGAIQRPNPEKMKPEEEEDLGEGDERILNLEKKNTKLIRWLFTCSRNDGTWNYGSKVINYVKDFHKTACKLPSSDVALTFERGYRRCRDVITCAHIMTPTEQIIILETRGQEPMNGAKGLERLLRSFNPKSHILGNKTLFFKPPRLFCLFENVIQKISLPLSMHDLLRIDGLYFPRSPNYKYYPLITKLGHIMECNSMREMEDGQLFPTYHELQFLISRASSFYTIPFQKGMPPAHVTSSNGNYRANFGDHEKVEKVEISLSEIDVPESLLEFVNKRSTPSRTIITPVDRLTNYSLSMTPGQRQAYKLRHAKAERLKKEEEFIDAVGFYNRSQVKMARTFTKKDMMLMSEDLRSFAIVPPCETLINLSPRRDTHSTRTQYYSPRQPSFQASMTSPRMINSARQIRMQRFD